MTALIADLVERSITFRFAAVIVNDALIALFIKGYYRPEGAISVHGTPPCTKYPCFGGFHGFVEGKRRISDSGLKPKKEIVVVLTIFCL